LKTIKGNFLCTICKTRFWDEVKTPDEVTGFISICLDCGHKMGLNK